MRYAYLYVIYPKFQEKRLTLCGSPQTVSRFYSTKKFQHQRHADDDNRHVPQPVRFPIVLFRAVDQSETQIAEQGSSGIGD